MAGNLEVLSLHGSPCPPIDSREISLAHRPHSRRFRCPDLRTYPTRLQSPRDFQREDLTPTSLIPFRLQNLNQSTGQNIAQSVLYRMDGQVAPWSSLHKERPVVLVFFSHDCDCSLEFANYFAVAMEKTEATASWFFLFSGSADQIHEFIKKTGADLPALQDPNSQLGHRLGITKSGCFILVQPDGHVSAIWPGTSLAGLNDLLSRLHLSPLSPNLPGLSGIPQAPTAGCQF